MLQGLLDGRRPLSITQNDAEERVLALTRAAGIPDPECRCKLHGFEADFYRPEAPSAGSSERRILRAQDPPSGGDARGAVTAVAQE